MDDIYGDLENYNDVNAFEELRGDNNDLKIKLDDYALKYAMLQEDYDRLAAEFKKLEMNYSSLLKTARAEVARKAQLIATLNSEKDMMILSAIKNSNKSVYCLRRNIRDKSSNRRSRRDEVDPRLMKKEKPEMKRYEPGDNRDRIEEKRLPSTDTVSSGATEDTNAIENKLKKLASYDIEESKENIAKSKKALSLKHRRKSMPGLGKQFTKFSSDEDDNCSSEDHQREWPSREDKNRKTSDRHKLSHKISETSGIDEKYSSYHESSKETYYKGKSHKYTDKSRNLRDKELRHKRPERRRRGTRDFPEESLRPEFPRNRVLESPPIERYDPQWRFRERKTIVERDEFQEDRPRQETNLHRQKRLGKHKSTSDHEEPCNKKARKKSCNQPAQEDIGWLKDNPVVEEKMAPEFGVDLYNASCQSPDYSHHDVISMQPKEIMNTAATKLEDPRLQSKRYVKKNYGDKVVFSAVSGRNIDLKLISTSIWDNERVEVPKALQKPPDDKDENAQDLYNLDNPLSNISAESGQIHSESNEMNMTDYVTASFFHDYENERIYQENATHTRNLHDFEEPKELFTQAESHKDNHIPIEAERRLPPVKYKLTRTLESVSESPNPLGLLLEQMKDKCGVSTAKAHDTKLDVDQTFGESPLKNNAKDKIEETKPASQVKSRRKTLAKEIVARDLEISDETSDNFVVSKNNNKEKIKTPELATHEKIKEKEELKEKKLRKAKTENVTHKISESTLCTKDASESKSEKKTKNKIQKEKLKGISPKSIKKSEVEKAEKKTNDKPDIEKPGYKTNYTQEEEKLQEESSEKLVVVRVHKTDKPKVEKVQKKFSGKLEKEKIQQITTDKHLENIAEIHSDKPDKEKSEKKTKQEVETSCGKRVVEKVHKIDKPKVEKDEKKFSGKLEKEKFQLSTTDKHLENIVEIHSNKPDKEKSEKKTKQEVEKVQEKSCGKQVVEKVHKIDKPKVEKGENKFSDKLEKEDTIDKYIENVAKKFSDKPNEENSEKKAKKGSGTNDNNKKAKFSELFGDSCSLITPEDLGVSIAPTESAKTYVPIFEDAQDSVDVSDKMLRVTKAAPVTINIPKDDQLKLDVVKENPDIPYVSTTEIPKKEDNLMVSIPIKITPYIDISKLITKEPVSTVIISTGVQPGIDCNANAKLNANNDNEKPQELNIPEGPVALATSTPSKRLLETEEECCNSSEVGSKKDTTTSSVNQSYTSNVEPDSEDVPDVRIFVRRRRRVKKVT